jgi:lysyl-tRNA synthetase class 2
MLRRLRAFFDAQGFLEVETPILSADTVVDRHLDPFSVKLGIQGSGLRVQEASGVRKHPVPLESGAKDEKVTTGHCLWLQTSPEFAMKRLLAAGAGPIYQIARVFRLDELGPLHNPEFTLVEWYQPGDDLSAGMQLTADLCETLLPQRGQNDFSASFSPTAERISYGNAFERYVGVDPHTANGAALKAVAGKLNVEAPASLSTDDRDGWLDLLLVERIQPHLGAERPTLIYDYPASQAALARIRQEAGKPPVAERFELYINGVEIANGYHELLDPAELRARNAATNVQRRSNGKPALPEESRLLAAMDAGLPASVGVALGFDRFLMAVLGVKTIAEVLAFPFDRA